MSWSEERIHRWLEGLQGREAPRGLVGAAGDDAAVLRRPRGREVVCVDQTIEGVHAAPGTPPRRVGAKAVARALSDLAATAARPRAVLVALRAPQSKSEAWIRAVLSAAKARARSLGADLVGGDLASAPGPAALSVTAVGELEPGLRPPGRDRARPGQVVVVTGPLGGSRLGRHLAIEPRLAEGRWLCRGGTSALIDVSDGFALDLSRLARSSGVRIELERVPVHRDARRLARTSGRSADWHALHDGEDYELIATLPPGALDRILRGARRRAPGLVVVGRVRSGSGVARIVDGRPRPLSSEGGWIHGRR